MPLTFNFELFMNYCYIALFKGVHTYVLMLLGLGLQLTTRGEANMPA